jgi:phosphohistidine phosphatase SixA
VQTAEIVAEHAGIEDAVSVCAELSPGRDPRDVVDLLGKRDSSAGPIALVGHEPQLSLIAGALLGEAEGPDLKKSGVIGIERAEDGAYAFTFWLDPKGLRVVRDRAEIAAAPEEPQSS